MGAVRYNATGPGMNRAIQEARERNMTIVFVGKEDERCQIIRLGYYLEEKGSEKDNHTPITWFTNDEINLTNEPIDTLSSGVEGRIQIGYLHPRREEKHSIIDFPIGKDNRLIIRFVYRVLQSKISDFMIQVEYRGLINGKEDWRSIVRYDCAHGFIHRDLLFIDGRKTKNKLPMQNNRQAINFAIDEIFAKLKDWLIETGYQSYAITIMDHPLVKEDIEKAKNKLIKLLEDPNQINNPDISEITIIE